MATIAALVGQHVVRRVIALLGRASIIIFILAMTIFVSAISLGIYIYSFFILIVKMTNISAHFFFSVFLTMKSDVLDNFAGGVGIANMIEKLENKDYMGFDNLCYQS